MGFVPLHNHSDYSLLDGASQLPKMVQRVKDLGIEALALTDHGVMYGAIELLKLCKKAEIKDLRFHDLRAFFATNALLSGMSIAQVSFLTGHKDWSQLKRYTRIKPEDLLDKVYNIVN